MQPLIYLSLTSWSAFDQRPHHFVRWYHEKTGGPVLWVNSYPTRLPNLGDFNRLRPAARLNSGNQLPPWLNVISIRALPIEPLKPISFVNIILWKKVLREIKNVTENEDAILCITKPSLFALQLLKTCRFSKVIYDVMDDYAAFYAGLSKHSMQSVEQRLLLYRPDVITSCTNLIDTYKGCGCNVQKVLNAVPETIRKYKNNNDKRAKKIIGYVGGIGNWFDWEWVVELARVRPRDTIRLIGPVFCAYQGRLPDNIEILGACSHESAMQRMAEFNLGIIPFRINEVTAAVDPIKYYEYIAQEVPVLATPFGEMSMSHKGEAGVFLAKINSIKSVVDTALEYSFPTHYRDEFIQANSWSSRFNKIEFMGNS